MSMVPAPDTAQVMDSQSDQSYTAQRRAQLDLIERTRHANRTGQEQWEKEMRDVAKLKNRDVAVLLLSWDLDRADSMYTTDELRDLRDVFERQYNFKVHTNLLSTTKGPAPRHQLNSMLTKFLGEHDKPGSLVIIYYGGHGMPNEEGDELRLLGADPEDGDPDRTEVNWSDVEPTLYRLRSDLLLIFDCCYAGLVARSTREWPASTSHFEFIGSTLADKTARGPKSDGSFTRAMIESLHTLSKRGCFNTKMLVRDIEMGKNFRKNFQQPIPHECGAINPLGELKIMPSEKGQGKESESVSFFLHLKYEFSQTPSQEHIKILSERLKDVIKNSRLPIKNVRWEGLSESNLQMSFADAAHKVFVRLPRRSYSRVAGPPEPYLVRRHTMITSEDGELIADQTEEAPSEPDSDGEHGQRPAYPRQLDRTPDRRLRPAAAATATATAATAATTSPIHIFGGTHICLMVLIIWTAFTLMQPSHLPWAWSLR